MSQKAWRSQGEALASAAAEVLSGLLGEAVHVRLQDIGEQESATLAAGFLEKVIEADYQNGGKLWVPASAASAWVKAVLAAEVDLAESYSDLEQSALNEFFSQLGEAFSKAIGPAASLTGSRLAPAEEVSAFLMESPTWFNVTLVLEEKNQSFMFVWPTSVVEGHLKSAPENQTAPASEAKAAGGVSPARVGSMKGGRTVAQGELTGNLNLLMDVPLKMTVELGRTTRLVKEILALAPGSVLELDKLAGEPVDILVNQRLIAKGEVVVIDENFGVRITEIVNPEERLTGLQG